jgi:hypothetical protein
MVEETSTPGPSESPAGTVVGGASTAPQGTTTGEAPPRRPRAGLAPQRGRRIMKEYPLTDSDLHDLRNTGIGAVICFSLGSVCIGMWSNIVTSMAFVPDAPKELLAVWADRQKYALWATIGFYALGLILIAMGFTRVEQIRSEVDFGDEGGHSRWIRNGILAVLAILLVGGGYWLGKHT